MRILYLSLSYVPSRRASSVQVMKMCSALAECGHDVTLVTKRCRSRLEPGVIDDHQFYGLKHRFPIKKLPRPEWRGGGLIYAVATAAYLLFRRAKTDLVFSREYFGAWLGTFLGRATIFEAHGVPTTRLQRLLFARAVRSRHMRRLVVISGALKNHLANSDLLPPDLDVLIAHDAADPLVAKLPAATSRTGPLRIGYIGSLYEGRGIGLILEVAASLPDMDFHLIGGSERDLEALRGTVPENVVLHGFVPPSALAERYPEFDVLLMPYQREVYSASRGLDTSAWMSPMKMFEYMSAGKAIVASDLPVLREVLVDRENAILIAPENAQAWRTALVDLQHDERFRRRLGEKARADFLANYTWEARSDEILTGI